MLKIVTCCQHPLPGQECGVTHQPQMLEPPLTRWHDWNEVNKYSGSRPRGQALLRYEAHTTTLSTVMSLCVALFRPWY